MVPATAEIEFRRNDLRELLISMFVELRASPNPSEGGENESALVVYILFLKYCYLNSGNLIRLLKTIPKFVAPDSPPLEGLGRLWAFYPLCAVPGIGTSNCISTGPNTISFGPKSISDL